MPWNTSVGPGAESGGATQLANGDIITIFTDRKQGGHWTSRPKNITDPLLEDWSLTNTVAGPLGSDMNAGWLGRDGQFRIVASCGPYQTNIPYGEMCLFVSNDTMRTWSLQTAPSQPAPGVLHRYTWKRCTELPAQCGGHTNPCDPGMFTIPGTEVSVVYTMQKTCQCSGREFYALGYYDTDNHKFTLLDTKSDLGNNAFDGGEGYAHMNVLDPKVTSDYPDGRMLWTGAVIEGDNDPSSCSRSQFPWTDKRGWFGTLTLPRVILLGNITHDDGNRDYFLQTPPLPELANLRQDESAINTSISVHSPTAIELPGGLRGRSIEVLAKFTVPPSVSDGSGWDVGLQLHWSDNDEEFTRVGIRDGTIMPGVDLWDEVNGDMKSITACSSFQECRSACLHTPTCGAWTYTEGPSVPNGLCRLKAQAHRSLLVTEGSPGCFLPTHGNWGGAKSTSGFIQQTAVRFAMLYIDRTKSHVTESFCGSIANLTADCYGRFGYAQMLRVLPIDRELKLHAYADRSIIEIFGQDGRAAVTARVYPTLAYSDRIGVFGIANSSADTWQAQTTVASIAAWRLSSANASRDEVLNP